MNILELDSYNLADAVKFNNKLNPRLWQNNKMQPDVRAKLLEIAADFKEFLGLGDLDVKDITVSGSNAGFSYTPHSDIDLHLVVDIPQADQSEVYRELFDAKKYQYNDLHDIKIGGYDVELYVENANKPPVSKGVYSVLNDDWISIPRKIRSGIDDDAVRSKYDDIGHRIDQAVESGDAETITRLTEKIKNMRQAGLDSHGELGPENLAYKMLRTQGYIQKLYDARNSARDQELSLKERKKPNSVFTYGFKHEESVEPIYMEDVPTVEPIPSDEEILKDFIKFCFKELKLNQMPTVKLRKDPQWSVRNRTFGRYTNEQHLLEVAWGQRHVMDVLRTVAHELTHKHQHERDGERMGPDAGETGSPYENEANARAGILMRDYGRLHPEFFDAGEIELEESASGYIPTKKQAKDPRWSMALTQDIRPGQLGKEANKLKLKTNKQGIPQIANPNGLFEKLALEFQLAKENIQTPIAKIKDAEQYYKFIVAKHKMGRPLTRQEQEFVRAHRMFNQKVAESVEQLDEVKMSPTALQRWAKSPEAQGIRAGFEAELIFRDTNSGDDDDSDMEPDYDMDERCRSIAQVVEFFQADDYGYGLSERQAARLQEGLDEQYMEWMDGEMYNSWRDERDELIREAWLRDKPMAERVHAFLVDGMDLSDQEADRIQAVGDKAPKFDSSKAQAAYAEENPDYATYLEATEGAEEILDEDVEQTIEKEDGFYDEVLDDFRNDFYVDDDSGFFDDVGLRWMSDVSNSYDLGWPYLMGSGGNGGSRDWESIGDSLNAAVDMPVKVSSNYHSTPRKEGMWIVEPDTSLQPDDSEDFGLEIVSPPMPLEQALEKLQQVTDWANSTEGNAYTNSSTGLHMGVSVPFKGGDVDYLKLILFLGDEYVLQQFGREANTYTKSAMSKFRENIKGGRADPAGAMKLMQSGLLELAHREIQKGVGEGKYTSAHIQKGYIEFRSAGGDWLAEENADPEKLSSTMLRYARAMSLAANPNEERREYAKKLYKLVAPEGDSQLALFSQFAAGELTAEQLKKKWAEKTIGTEKKMNQRFRLYQNVEGRWEPVPGAEWNGYPESEVKNKIWAKYGREALDSGEYQLVNMGEQDWEVYDVKTGATLEIVKGKSKGEVADAVYDKYVDQGIGFQVRPYVDPATLTPRAKLAKNIVSKPQGPETYTYYKWNIANPKTGENDYDYMTRERVFQTTKQVEKENPRLGKYTNTIVGGGSAQLTTSNHPRDIDTMTFDFRAKGSNEVIEQQTYNPENAEKWQARPVVAAIERANKLSEKLGKPVVAYEVQPKQEPEQTVDTYRGKWEFFYAPTGRVLDAVNDASIMQARAVLADTQRRYDDLPSDQIQMRKAGAVQDVEPDVAQNFSQPTGDMSAFERNSDRIDAIRQDATQRTGSWAIYDVTLGREISRMDNVPWQQASDRADELERSTGHSMSVRGLQENFADGRNPQDKGDSVRHGIPKGATIAQLEKAAKAPGRKGQLARWQLNMRRGKAKAK